MIAQLTSILFVTFCSSTVGALLKRYARWKASYFLDFLIGFAICNGVLTLISIFFAIDTKVVISFSCSIMLVAVFNARWLNNYIREAVCNIIAQINTNKTTAFFATIICIICFFKSLYAPSLHADAGLYHIQSIKWIIEYPTINGLANLNPFFGYNFNIFSWFAATSFKDFYGQNIYSINITLTLYFIVWLLQKITTSQENKKYLLASCYVLIFERFVFHYFPHLSTTTVNISIFIILIVAFESILCLKKYKDNIYFALILLVFSVTIRVSAAPALLLVVGILAINYKDLFERKYVISLLSCGVIMTGWIIKNVLMTGWLLYPFPYIDIFPFNWKVPKINVVGLKEGLKIYAQGNWKNSQSDWISSWLNHQNIIDLLLLASLPVLLLLFLLKIRAQKQFKGYYELVAIIACLGGVLFMMFNVPTLVYSVGFILALVLIVTDYIGNTKILYKYLFYGFSLVVIANFLTKEWFHPWHFMKHADERVILPYSIANEKPIRFNSFMIDNRVKCYYPKGTQQCLDCELPCSMEEINNRLHLRGKTIGQGFYLSAN
ncbi:LIC_10190 family membrane protein [Spirosoma fluviale]|uniref:DUF8201 domain-containing protein n=1 Tax=Spirosoma fluviale TaxID=1597977 RepID=A0A286FDX5_9BACT|nr:hypothetical protein [Spirosoma fluviale]SOD81189.1 hypothetical protein SAMN06269250_1704 [Spirosoma fluviale]